jgi:hypothetical protein
MHKITPENTHRIPDMQAVFAFPEKPRKAKHTVCKRVVQQNLSRMEYIPAQHQIQQAQYDTGNDSHYRAKKVSRQDNKKHAHESERPALRQPERGYLL